MPRKNPLPPPPVVSEVVAVHPELRPLDISKLTAPGFTLDGNRAKGTSYHDLIALILQEDPTVFADKLELIAQGNYELFKSMKEIIVRQTIQRTTLGDQKALDFLADRDEGKVTQSFTVATEDRREAYINELRQNVLGAPAQLMIEGEVK
jgi:hypothetical protein